MTSIHEDKLIGQQKCVHVVLPGFAVGRRAKKISSPTQVELGRPTEGLSKLAEAEALMEPSARIGLLGDRAVALLALGRDGEALECFRQIASPERLAHMRGWDYIGLVDFRLVDAFLKKRLAPDLCIAYLDAAEAIAERHNSDRVSYVRGLLARAREAAA